MMRGFQVKPKAKVQIDWDTVELVDYYATSLARPARPQRLFPDRRGRSVVKQILSGAAAKARARGAVFTHTQICKRLPAGLPTLIYGWGLVFAAMESDRDLSRGVEVAADVILATSRQVAQHAAFAA